MEIDPDKLYAVITGDIIGSSGLPDFERKKLYEVMRSGGDALRAAHPKAVPLDIDIFRGDSWQLLVADPGMCMRTGLLYRLYLKAYMQNRVDTRMAFAVGRISFIPGRRVSEGEGRAFYLSGKALEDMEAFCSMAFSLDDLDIRSEVFNSIVILLDAVVSDLSEKQSLALYGALLNQTQNKIATLWNPAVKQQTVAKLLKRAQWRHLEKVLYLFENSLYRLFSENTDV